MCFNIRRSKAKVNCFFQKKPFFLEKRNSNQQIRRLHVTFRHYPRRSRLCRGDRPDEQAPGLFLDIGGDFFLSPNEPQQKYLASLAQGFFLYHMAGMDPSCGKIRKDVFCETSWILDASVILQYLAIGCAGYDYAQSLLGVLIDSGATLYITDKLLLEVQKNLNWAKKLVDECGVDSPEFRDAALAKGGYKQNLFIV